nr:hypothetical protein Puna18p_00136 [Serratia proteamaculans]
MPAHFRISLQHSADDCRFQPWRHHPARVTRYYSFARALPSFTWICTGSPASYAA